MSERTDPDLNVNVALAQTDTDADTGAAPTQTGHDASTSAAPAQADPVVTVSAEPQQAEPDAGAVAARYALEMIGTPYRYGGKTPKGLDCSGLVLYSYARAGKQLPPNTRGQRAASHPIKRAQLRPGDLLFFNLQGRQNSHVALYLGDGEFVHAPRTGKVVSTANLSNPFWRRNLAGARRPALDQHLARHGTSTIASASVRPVLPREGI
ncbi:MAG TPA: C40 family peptidase [Burkholderiales bacterium]|nr:C40 family peptidase [Burkholderiales bacterium]